MAMRFGRTVFLLALCGLVAVPGLATAGSKKGVKLHVSPAGAIRLDQAVTVSWRTDVTLAPRQAYQATFAAGQPSGDVSSCVRTRVRIVGRGSSRGSLVRVRFTPRSSAGATSWCASQYPAFVYVARVTVGADGKPDLSRQQPLKNVGQSGPLTLSP